MGDGADRARQLEELHEQDPTSGVTVNVFYRLKLVMSFDFDPKVVVQVPLGCCEKPPIDESWKFLYDPRVVTGTLQFCKGSEFWFDALEFQKFE